MGTANSRAGLLLAALCLLASHGGRAAAFLISTPYSLCVCPEGQSVTLSCRISGALAERHDLLYKTWYFSSTGDQSCSDKRHVRNVTEKELHHDLSRHHEPPGNGSQKSPLGRQGGHRGVELVPDHHGAFHIVAKEGFKTAHFTLPPAKISQPPRWPRAPASWASSACPSSCSSSTSRDKLPAADVPTSLSGWTAAPRALKTPCSRQCHRWGRSHGPDPSCPMWPAGCPRSLAGICSRNPAPHCPPLALEIASSPPWILFPTHQIP